MPDKRFDFFLSRRGSVAAIAREVADVLSEKGYRVFVQDYDMRLGESLIAPMHQAIKNSRDLIVLYTNDYLESAYTLQEFHSFKAEQLQGTEARRIVVLRCEDVMPRGFLADSIYQDIFGIDDPQERKRRIIAAAEGHSQSLRPPPRPFVGVPPRIAGFTGRTAELARLDAILVPETPTVGMQSSTSGDIGRAAIQGLGGIGKTSLATEYAHRSRSRYAGVWWCAAETRAGLLTSLAALAVTLGSATDEEPDVEKAAKAALRQLAEQRACWLLVYDNVTAPEEVADLWPAAGARVLITSRFADWAGWAEEVALDVPSIGEAAAYLQSRAAHDDEAGARELAEALGRLPLALDHAAATCRRTHMRFADFAARASRMIEAAPRGAGYPRSVAATFDLAIAEAVAHCPAAEALMAFLAQCTHERVPMTLVEGAIDRETERLHALTTLAEMSLLRHDPFEDGTPAVMVHRLVQAAARARTEARGIAQSAFERMMARFAAIYPTDNSNARSWPLCAQLTPHLLAQRHAVAEDLSRFEPWPELLNRAGSYLHARGASAQAIPLLRDTLAIYEKTLGAEDANTGTALNNLALLLSDQGNLPEARQLYERALAIHEKTLGPEHPLTATTLNNLARLLADQGDHAAARPLYERALAIHEKTPGPRHPDTAASLGNLANMFRTTGDLAQARVLYERARSIYEEALGPDHSTTAASLNDLANVLTDLGDFASAQVLYERALAICERTLGLEHPSTATSLNNLARLLADRLEFEKARPLYVRAAAIWEKTLGPEHPNTNRIRCNQARLLLTMGDASAAFALGQSALAAHGKALGRNHPWTADSARVTAEALEAAGRTEEAAALCATYGVTCGDH